MKKIQLLDHNKKLVRMDYEKTIVRVGEKVGDGTIVAVDTLLGERLYISATDKSQMASTTKK